MHRPAVNRLRRGVVSLAGLLFFALPLALPAADRPEVIETSLLRLVIRPATGGYEVLDRASGVTWRSNPSGARFGEATVRVAGRSQRVALARCEVRGQGRVREVTFHPLPGQAHAWLRVRIRVLPDRRTLEFGYASARSVTVEHVRLLDDALAVTAADRGYVVVPVREGLLVPSDRGPGFTNQFDTFGYEGCHMEMLGVVKRGSAALVTWTDPYVTAELEGVVQETNQPQAGRTLLTSLTLRKSATACRITFLGQGDYVAIAKAYRAVAKARGWWVPWSRKLRQNPERAELFGAVDFKLWSALDRRMNEASTRQESVRVNWTFAEAAQVAEHLKRDLKLDRVLFILGGWTHRGYDNQHPDILPAAPECGGNAGLADCAQRVRRLGYFFCLHDNYQDIYRDSPSWNEDLIMKHPDGSLVRGGRWAGGRAYLTCSRMALQLARRPQNLPAVKRLTGADAYFIDTTFAAGLQECFDPRHPLTRSDDMKWKQALADYARGLFGIFGSEDGREWAIPHSDFFEGLTGVSGHSFHDAGLPQRLGASVVPLFEIVYRDCIAMYGKYGYRPDQAAGYVLEHVSLGRPLNYHSIPPHLYWKTKADPGAESPSGEAAVFTRADHGWAEGLCPLDRFIKNTYEILSPLNALTAPMAMTDHRFLTTDDRVQLTRFGHGPAAVEVVVNAGSGDYRWRSRHGGEVLLPTSGFLVEAPGFVAFHARSWNGLHYDAPAMFTLRSLNGRALSDPACQVRVFHAFGDPRIALAGGIRSVKTEEVFTGTD